MLESFNFTLLLAGVIAYFSQGAGWLFSRQVIDQTPELIDEPAIRHKSEVADSWPAALELMDRYRWRSLSPQDV